MSRRVGRRGAGLLGYLRWKARRTVERVSSRVFVGLLCEVDKADLALAVANAPPAAHARLRGVVGLADAYADVARALRRGA